MATSTVEQYVKVIYQEQQKRDRSLVQMKQLTEAMNVTPGTATTMVKHLDDLGYIRYRPRRGVELLGKGKDLAIRIIRRHRLIETFLEHVLRYDWAEVHEEAEQLEHAVSDLFVARIDAHLGFPSTDPHGDPIPSVSGVFQRAPSCLLTETEAGATVAISRLTDDTKAFLDMMRENSIVPGEKITVETIDPVARVVTVTNTDRKHRFTMAQDVATHILVSPASATRSAVCEPAAHPIGEDRFPRGSR